MAGSGELSRRALFGAGLGRLLDQTAAREHAGADQRWRLSPAPPFAGWGEGDAGGLGGRLGEVASAILTACDVRAGTRVLVAGAGDGVLARAAARAGATVTAVEPSPERVERGRALCARQGMSVDWAIGSCRKPPVDESAYDAVMSLFVASHDDEPRSVAQQLTRAARPGAPICLTAWTGFMAELLRTAGLRAARSERWARFETAYLHFFDFPDLDVRETATRWQFTTPEQAIEQLAAPGAAIGVADTIRDALPALLDRHGTRTDDGGLTIRSSYATVFARRP